MVKNNRAFSLIEVLVVISVIVLLLSVAVPSLMRSTAGVKLRTAAASYASLANAAKSMAVAQACKVELVYDSVRSRILLKRQDIDDADNDSDVSEFIAVDQGTKIEDTINVNVSGGLSGSVVFAPWGGVEGVDVSVVFTSSQLSKNRIVSINKETGYVKVQ